MKKIILLFFAGFVLFLGMNLVEATSKTDVSVYENFATNLTTKECDALFGDPEQPGDLAYYLQKVLDVMKYLGIILCIVLTIVDFGKAILGEDKDMYKPLAKTAFNRLCYAVMLFLLPTIIETILRLIDVYGTCGIS